MTSFSDRFLFKQENEKFKTRIFLLKKKHDLLHSTIERSERESYCAMRARESSPEAWETLSAYSIFHTPPDAEVMRL